MTKEDLILFWINSSEENYKSMFNLFNAGEYMWALFIGHLVIEKLLKAHYVKSIDNIEKIKDLKSWLIEKMKN